MSEVLLLLDPDYRKFDTTTLPCPFSERLLSPVLSLARINGQYTATLGAWVRKAGERRFVACPGNNYNWLLDGGRIKPLPHDVPILVTQTMVQSDPMDLRYPQVLALIRDGIDGVEVFVERSVTESANERCSSMALSTPVEGLNATLYPYQEHGVAWLRDALNSFGGAILADEMGLGKTLQIIALFLQERPTPEHPALVLCPTTLIANWCREVLRFAPSLSILVHRGPDRTGYFRDLMKADVVVTTYDTLVNDVTMFRGVNWHYVVCDEAQAVKNPDSRRRKALSALPRRYTIPVTGTPVENSLIDLWSLADLAIPGVLDSQEVFSALYPDTDEGAQSLSSLTDTLILKRQVKDVAGDLPLRTDVDLPVELNPDSVQQYDLIRQQTMDEYGIAGRLVAVGQLALYCAHPWLRLRQPDAPNWEDLVELAPDPAYPLMTPKMEVCIELLRESVRNQRKVLIFTAYNCCGELIKRAADEQGVGVEYWNAINGSTPQSERQPIVDRFSAVEGAAVLVLNPKAAGAGLNITAATVVIHYTQNWNPALEMQASARAHRRGQEQPVTIYRLFYQGTVEQTMVERSQWKRELGNEAVPISIRDKKDLGKALMKSPIKEVV